MKRVGGKTMAGIMNKVLELFTSEDYEDEEEEVLSSKGYSTDYEEDEEGYRVSSSGCGMRHLSGGLRR